MKSIERSNLDEARARLRAIVDETNAKLTVLDNAAAIVAEMMGETPRAIAARDVLSISAEEIEGLSVLEAAIKIAEANDGLFLSTPARALMVQAGILEAEDNAASTLIYTALNRSGRFESAGKRAHYRLVVAQPVEQPDVSEDVIRRHLPDDWQQANGVYPMRVAQSG